MNRRDFLRGGLTAIGGGFFANSTANAETTAAAVPIRTGRLADPAILSGNITCQDAIFDGSCFICLYRK